jgi:hypothetical protein
MINSLATMLSNPSIHALLDFPAHLLTCSSNDTFNRLQIPNSRIPFIQPFRCLVIYSVFFIDAPSTRSAPAAEDIARNIPFPNAKAMHAGATIHAPLDRESALTQTCCIEQTHFGIIQRKTKLIHSLCPTLLQPEKASLSTEIISNNPK